MHLRSFQRNKTSTRITVCLVYVFFVVFSIIPPAVNAQRLPRKDLTILKEMSPAGTMVHTSGPFDPPVIKGLEIHPQNPFLFDFIISPGDARLEGDAFYQEAQKLIEYFFSSLTIPEREMWVNLSPREKNRIIPESLGQTLMGMDMLSQDYTLKQLTASLFNPENNLGQTFWDRVYQAAYEKYGHTDIDVDTFHKVWIVPDEAEVYETNGKAFVISQHLKVMLEEDYLGLKTEQTKLSREAYSPKDKFTVDLMRNIILPELEKEVNQGEHFAKIRQIFNSLILAAWYKKTLRQSLLGQLYVDKAKTAGVDISDKEFKFKIYDQYMKAFKKGVFSRISMEYDEQVKKVIPRKYFSGGIELSDSAMSVENLVVLRGRLRDQSARVREIVSAQLLNDKKVTAGLLLTDEDGALVSSGERSSSGRPVITAMEVFPAPGEHVALGLDEEIEVTAQIRVEGAVADLTAEDIHLSVWTNLALKNDQKPFIQEDGNHSVWHAIAVEPRNISFREGSNGSVGYYTAKIKVDPGSTGLYAFKLNARMAQDSDPVWAEGKDTTVQVAFLPAWFDRARMHPQYVFWDDVKLLGYRPDWSGVNAYLRDTAEKTGKNFFMLAPFFPTNAASPFSPLSVYALSPRMINWQDVPDHGHTPLEKYRDFKLHAAQARKTGFSRYREIPQIQQYAGWVRDRLSQDPSATIYGVSYKGMAFENSEEMFDFLVYEQFLNLEQFYNLLKYQHAQGNYVTGDLPFYRNVGGVMVHNEPHYFAHDGGQVDNPGFEGSLKVVDLAAWDEIEIQKRVQAGETDPRLHAYQYWNNVIKVVFDDEITTIDGWRIDAFHMYGRGAHKDGARRLIWDARLWEETAKYFRDAGLFLMAEQLGGDAHAYYHFNRLGFFMNAFVLDLKPKTLRGLLNELNDFSRGIAFTVANTHDSQRWANEYFPMFEYLTGLQGQNNQDEKARERILRLAGPIFLGLTSLIPKVETASLSLGEYATQAPIKEEIRDESGQYVLGSKWGTESVGTADLSAWLKKFAEIREENPAISHAAGLEINNNDNDRLVSVVKISADNKLLILGNFYKEPQRIQLVLPDAFGVSAGQVAVMKNLINSEQEMEAAHGRLDRLLAPGEFAVYRLESVKAFENAEIDEEGPGDAQMWNWAENKNKRVMFHPEKELIFENGQPFEVHLNREREPGERTIYKSKKVRGPERYLARIPSLDPGNYTVTFFWYNKQANGGWEGEGGNKHFYHFKVIAPDFLQKEGLSIKLTRADLDAYPHNTVTLSNGIGSILRIPVRPLNRELENGAIRVGGYVSKYDGFLANLFKRGIPDESKRVLYRGAVEDIAVTFADGTEWEYPLDTSTFDHFQRYPLPSWVFILGEGDRKVVLEKTAVCAQNENAFAFHYKIASAGQDVSSAKIFVRPELDQRLHHEITRISPESLGAWVDKHEVTYDEGQVPVGFYLKPVNDAWRQWYPGFEGVKMYATNGGYEAAHERHFSHNPLESERGEQGIADHSDSYSPGFFTLSVNPQESSSIVFASQDRNTSRAFLKEQGVAAMVKKNTELVEERVNRIKDALAREDPFVQKMVIALWEFVVERDEFYTVIAGHPWFSDWGRDTFIAFDGILAAGMDDVALGLIKAFGKFEGKDGNKGMLPNIIQGAEAGNWDTVDAPLLYILAVKNYIAATHQPDVLAEQSGTRTIQEIIESIIEGYQEGTANGIHMDQKTGLIYSPPHFTWMDTNYPAATPREGYTVENNARWYDVLMWASELYEHADPEKFQAYRQLAQKVKKSFNQYFWYEEGQYLADTVVASPDESADRGRQDTAIRPNQLIAVHSPYGLLSKERKIKVVSLAESKLLVPAGLRSLSEDTRSSEEFPYRGTYEGSDDHGRKQAYHNGTVWPHLFGDWALAYVTAHEYSQESIDHVLPYFTAFEEHLAEAGIGSVSEVRDGNYPHRPRGADAQAWSVAVPLAAYMQIKYGGPADAAIVAAPTEMTPGGIDFNASLMKLKIRRDNRGFPLPLSDQPVCDMPIERFSPVILDISPVDIGQLFQSMNWN